MTHSWAWSRGAHNLDRCKRIGCTAERIARENGSPRYLYRVNATAAWSAKAPACGVVVIMPVIVGTVSDRAAETLAASMRTVRASLTGERK